MGYLITVRQSVYIGMVSLSVDTYDWRVKLTVSIAIMWDASVRASLM